MNVCKLILATVLTTAVVSTANATVVGSTVTGVLGTSSFGDLLDETTTVTDPGVEFDFIAGPATLSLDITEDVITVLYDLGGFSEVGDTSSWTVTGFTDSFFDLTLTSGNASLVTGLVGDATSFSIDFVNFIEADHGQINTFTFERVPATVPLPAGGALLLASVLGLGTARRAMKSA